MKTALSLILGLASIGLGNQQSNRIRFDPVQPLGQRSHYKLQYEGHCRNLDAEGLATDDAVALRADLETIATSGGPDGGWSLGYTFKSMNIQCEGDDNSVWNSTKSAGFSILLEKHGKVIEVLGTDPDYRSPEDADLGSMQDVLLYLLPTQILPRRPVAKGERWLVDETTFLGEEGDFEQLTGKAVLKSVAGDLAFIEVEFALKVYFSDALGRPDLAERGSGIMILTYDLCHARFVKAQLHSVIETVGWALSDNDGHVQTIIDNTLAVQLLKQ